MTRIVCGLEYDGSAYRGWQRQLATNTPTVQGALEKALSFVANQPVDVVCAGRTDCGVHATSQVIHFDTTVARSHRSWLMGGNANMPADVRLQWVREASEDFHARFSAISRSYRYVIYNHTLASAILRSRVCWERQALDETRMADAASYLVGEHDFTSFRARACQANRPVRTITRLQVTRQGQFVYLDIDANAFLYHMVRNIAGALLEVGRGEREPEWIAEVLAQCDRDKIGITAPADGLYLVRVEYPADFDMSMSAYLPVYG
ncbi:MAG: tRNA pseudouridine(38-40) synthase TruA [Gammaproteobacteria bacterium]